MTLSTLFITSSLTSFYNFRNFYKWLNELIIIQYIWSLEPENLFHNPFCGIPPFSGHSAFFFCVYFCEVTNFWLEIQITRKKMMYTVSDGKWLLFITIRCCLSAIENHLLVFFLAMFFLHPCQKVKTKLISRGKISYDTSKHVRLGSLRIWGHSASDAWRRRLLCDLRFRSVSFCGAYLRHLNKKPSG